MKGVRVGKGRSKMSDEFTNGWKDGWMGGHVCKAIGSSHHEAGMEIETGM